MINNSLKIIIRNLRKDKFYSLINICGLSIGIACSLLILLYVVDELSYDKHYSDADRIYRVVTKAILSEEEAIHTPASSAPLAEAFGNTIPEIEEITRIRTHDMIIQHNGSAFKEEDVIFADSSFFQIFDLNIIHGDPINALVDPNSLVLTESMALKYYGEKNLEEGSIIGQHLVVGNQNYEITAICKDMPHNSHFHADFLISMRSFDPAQSLNWMEMNFQTYLKLDENIDPATLENSLYEVAKQNIFPLLIQYMNFPPEQFEQKETADDVFQYQLQPLTSIHLHSHLKGEIEPNSDISYVYIFSAIAVFILILACINFMNLATARSARRSLEVGIRKTMGSTSEKLVGQFMFESFIFTAIAMLIALGLAEALRTPFNYLAGKNISLSIFDQPWLLAAIVGITITVSVLAGIYPAFYLTSFKPVDVLKGNLLRGGGSKSRSTLVTFQFMISIGLIICSLLVYKQMNYVSNRNLGFNKENVILVKNGWELGDNHKVLKAELLKQSQIKCVSFTGQVPSYFNWSTSLKQAGKNVRGHQVYVVNADYDYISTMGMKIIHGRDFSENIPSDDSCAVLINQSAAKRFGWYENEGREALGKKIEGITDQYGKRIQYKIVGIINDFNFESFKNEIQPMAMFLREKGSRMAVRVESGNISNSLKIIESNWNDIAPEVPFEYSFLDEDFEGLFESEQKLGNIFGIFAVLAIFIACLGLLGLAAYTAEQRSKELGVRKVMGASVYDLVGLLNRDFTRLIIFSFVIAAPLAWYFMSQWLQNFVYKTSIGIGPFIIAGLGAVLITWVTVSYQSIKASLSNPVKSLRAE